MSTLAAALAQVNLPGLGEEGPEDLQRLLSLFGLLMGLGFLIGLIGHGTKSRTIVAIGIGLIFLATALFLIAIARFG